MSAVRLELVRAFSARVLPTSKSRRFSSRHQRRIKFKIDVASKAGKARVHDGFGKGASWARQGLLRAGQLTWLACVAHCLKEHVVEPCAVHGPSMQRLLSTSLGCLSIRYTGTGGMFRLLRYTPCCICILRRINTYQVP